MSIISKLVDSSSVDQTNIDDYSGGGYIGQSGIYDLVLKRAWVIESEKGSIGIHIEFEGEGMLEKDLYISNANKQTYYVKDGKEFAMPSYTDMKKLNYILTGVFMTSLKDLKVSQQIVKTYDVVDDPENEGKKKRVDVEKEVEYLNEWAGKSLKVGIQMEEQEESKKTDNGYVKTGKLLTNKDDIPILNPNIIGFYHAETRQTANEIKNEKDAEQIEKDYVRLEKSPIKKLKSKSSQASSSTATKKTVGKPDVF